MQNVLPILYFLYAIALFGGGVMGYVTAKSTPSLVGSSIFAILAIGAGLLLRSRNDYGYLLGIEVSLLVIGLFVYRFIETGKTMPAMPAIAMSVIAFVVTVLAFVAAKRPA